MIRARLLARVLGLGRCPGSLVLFHLLPLQSSVCSHVDVVRFGSPRVSTGHRSILHLARLPSLLSPQPHSSHHLVGGLGCLALLHRLVSVQEDEADSDDEDDAQDDDDTDLALRPVLLTLGELVEDRVGRGEGGNGGHCE